MHSYYFIIKAMNTNDYSNLDLSGLPLNARQEIIDFYSFIISRYQSKTTIRSVAPKNKFSKFLSTTIKTDNFIMLNRDERNER